MPEMPHDELGSLVDAIRTRLQTELQTQFASLEEQQAQALAAARRDADQAADARWASQLNAVQEDWNNRLQSEVAAARAEAEQRATEAMRARAEIERQAAGSAERVQTWNRRWRPSWNTRDTNSTASERARAELSTSATLWPNSRPSD
jgi:predicted membrane-bound mannosyltransferase